MNFFTMLSAVEAEKQKQANAIAKKTFTMPAVGEADAAAAADPAPKKSTKKKKEVLPEGPEADNVIQEESPEDEEDNEEE